MLKCLDCLKLLLLKHIEDIPDMQHAVPTTATGAEFSHYDVIREEPRVSGINIYVLMYSVCTLIFTVY